MTMTWRQENGIVELALSSPPCNEIGVAALEGFERFLKEVDVKKTRALIVYSALESGFCAGADLRQLYREILSRPRNQHAREMTKFLDRIHKVMDTIDGFPFLTIGVIHGACFGGGFELALTMDLLIAEPTARFCFPELRLGIIPGFGGIPRLKRDLANGVVRDLLLTGRSINAKKAQAVGLVSQVVAEREGFGVARQMAEQAAKFDPAAAGAAKRFLKPIPKKELAEEKRIFVRLFRSPVVTQALRKFVESDDLRPYLP
jgi:enoyl-CoA hydratase/carnithine racemase